MYYRVPPRSDPIDKLRYTNMQTLIVSSPQRSYKRTETTKCKRLLQNQAINVNATVHVTHDFVPFSSVFAPAHQYRVLLSIFVMQFSLPAPRMNEHVANTSTTANTNLACSRITASWFRTRRRPHSGCHRILGPGSGR